ncbi:hypothetical protein PCANB_000314 [Pneumocystis canis]|nr:hypothetical protein PCANB_000314 [Pneumocystis canis]
MIPKIASIANNYLYVRIFSEKDADLAYHFMIHSACDELEALKIRNISDENSQNVKKSGLEVDSTTKLNDYSRFITGNKIGSSDMYLGLLYAQETASVYGSITNTQVKFIVVLDTSEMTITDTDMKPLFKAIHSAYIGHVCNPFYTFDDKTPIQSRKFDKMIEHIVESWTPGTQKKWTHVGYF